MNKRGPNTPEGKAKSLANLKKMKPGETLNPKGRPPAGATVREWFNAMQGWTIEQLNKAMADPKMPVAKVAAARCWIHASTLMFNASGTPIAGADLDRLFDRTIGKPAQAIELSGRDGEAIEVNHNIDLSKLSTDELRQYRELRLKMDATN